MSQTPAGWFADPGDASQYRYWDGAAWTEHRAPRTADSAAELGAAVSGALTSVGSWVQRTVGSDSATPAQPTFASIAAVCRDEPARQPLSRFAEVEVSPADFDGVAKLLALAATTLTPDGVTLSNEVCRLVPNPWDRADPTGVAVFISTFMVGRLPAAVAAEYSAVLTDLTQQHQLATGTATVWAEGPGHPTAARVTVSLPDPAAFAD